MKAKQAVTLKVKVNGPSTSSEHCPAVLGAFAEHQKLMNGASMATRDQTTLPPCRHQRGMLLLLVVACLLPTRLFAQSHALRVTLRDAGGAGIAGISISVRSEDGEELARQTTGGDGAASFDDLPAVVRVAVAGQPRGGPRLYQLGADAQGVRVVLDASDAPVSLDLRAERDGLVLPDPATMLSLEEGGPSVVDVAPLPTAAIATPAPLPTSPSSAGSPSSTTAGDAAPPQASWVPLVTVLIVAVAAGVMALIQRRRSAL